MENHAVQEARQLSLKLEHERELLQSSLASELIDREARFSESMTRRVSEAESEYSLKLETALAVNKKTYDELLSESDELHLKIAEFVIDMVYEDYD